MDRYHPAVVENQTIFIEKAVQPLLNSLTGVLLAQNSLLHSQLEENLVAWNFIAGCLCGFQQFDGPIPISKRLWTFSFAALLSGWGFLVLAGLYLLIDHFKVWSGAPFNFVGMNSILIYILHENLSGQVPFCGVECTSTTTNHMIQMWTQTGAVAVWILYAYYCHLRKFYLVI